MLESADDTPDDQTARLAKRYQRFAAEEASSSSALYYELASHIAGSDWLLKFLQTLPSDRQQPNLFLAAVRLVGGVPDSPEAFERVVRQHESQIRHVMLSRTTQTNEPARCAVLLPVLAQLPQPLALLEVGAAAGLCLLPDRYAYDYNGVHVGPTIKNAASAPVFPCQPCRNTPVPTENVEVVWRAGLDLNPLNLHSDEDVEWLRTLVWPEHHDRAERLSAAISIARAVPPNVQPGNLLNDLAALSASAPKDATLVIFHTAVLGYLPRRSDREQFAAMVAQMDATWISNEAPRVLPSIAETGGQMPQPGLFLLAVNGTPRAWTGPHGQSVEWIDRPR